MKRILLTSFLIIGLMSSVTIAAEEEDMEKNMDKIEHLRPDAYKEMGLPFSAAVRVGDMLYLSGQIGNLPGTKDLAPGGIEGETRQTMENIKMVVEKYGSSMNHVIKCTIFMADMTEWAAMNAVYVTYFPEDRLPARAAFGTSGLALDARVEIECIAVIK